METAIARIPIVSARLTPGDRKQWQRPLVRVDAEMRVPLFAQCRVSTSILTKGFFVRHRKIDLSIKELRQDLQYDPENGLFVWRKSGLTAGCTKKNGYVFIKYKKYPYKAHRLVFYYLNGHIPDLDVDHINGVRSDNRIENLRLVSNGQNQQNRKRASVNNKSGFLGVYPENGRYRALIQVDGKKLHLGIHDTPELAHADYLQAKAIHHIKS